MSSSTVNTAARAIGFIRNTFTLQCMNVSISFCSHNLVFSAFFGVQDLLPLE